MSVPRGKWPPNVAPVADRLPERRSRVGQVRSGLSAGGKWIRTLGPTEDAGRPWPVSVHVRADYLSLPGTQAEATSAGLETLVVSRGTENPASSSSESYKPVPVMIGLDAATPITCSQLSSSDLDRAHPIGLQRVDLSTPCTCWWVSVPFIFPRLSLWRFLRAASQASVHAPIWRSSARVARTATSARTLAKPSPYSRV